MLVIVQEVILSCYNIHVSSVASVDQLGFGLLKRTALHFVNPQLEVVAVPAHMFIEVEQSILWSNEFLDQVELEGMGGYELVPERVVG